MTSMDCPRADAILRLLDGELTRNEEASLRAHLAECAACRAEEAKTAQLLADVKAPIFGLADGGMAAQVMERVRRGDAPAAPAPRRRFALYGGACVTAAAAALALVVGLRGGPVPSPHDAIDPAFQARGGAHGPSLARDVGVTVYYAPPRSAPRPSAGAQGLIAAHVPLAAGATVAADVAYTATYRNLERDQPVHLMVFAVDAKDEIHWLYPAYTDRAVDPTALRLPPAATETLLPDSVVLDDVPPGRLRVVTLIAREPIHVSTVEALPKSELSASRLGARFAGSRVEELAVTVAGPVAP